MKNIQPVPVVAESDDRHLRRIEMFLREARVVVDYLHWRVCCRRYGDLPESPLFKMAADDDGELTDEQVVEYLEAIARQAHAGFVEGKGFPIFLPLEDYLRQDKQYLRQDKQLEKEGK